MKQKLEQVNKSVKKALGTILLKELPNASPLTVIDVLIDPSYQHGRAWLQTTSEILALVEAKRPEIQAQLSRYVKLRYTPKLSFIIDDNYLNKLDELFAQLDKS